ncbi:LOW QUALITY PROTEIN: hypothetical protein CRUP_015802 [Coryphaenoides rupestris]|nr:LOW QUALITY PROTEIN: hypothetical protein CRUP_015802 [Coryphaenoides rupestris]
MALHEDDDDNAVTIVQRLSQRPTAEELEQRNILKPVHGEGQRLVQLLDDAAGPVDAAILQLQRVPVGLLRGQQRGGRVRVGGVVVVRGQQALRRGALLGPPSGPGDTEEEEVEEEERESMEPPGGMQIITFLGGSGGESLPPGIQGSRTSWQESRRKKGLGGRAGGCLWYSGGLAGVFWWSPGYVKDFWAGRTMADFMEGS